MKINLVNNIEAVVSPDQLQMQVLEYENRMKANQQTKKQALANLDADIQGKVNELRPRLATDTYESKLDDGLNRKLAIGDAKRIKHVSKALQIIACCVGLLAVISGSLALATTMTGGAALLEGVAAGLIYWKIGVTLSITTIGLTVMHVLAKQSALLLNHCESIRAKRVYCSENFKHFVEKFVNNSDFAITQHQKKDYQLHALYLNYKYSVLEITAKN